MSGNDLWKSNHLDVNVGQIVFVSVFEMYRVGQKSKPELIYQ